LFFNRRTDDFYHFVFAMAGEDQVGPFVGARQHGTRRGRVVTDRTALFRIPESGIVWRRGPCAVNDADEPILACDSFFVPLAAEHHDLSIFGDGVGSSAP